MFSTNHFMQKLSFFKNRHVIKCMIKRLFLQRFFYNKSSADFNNNINFKVYKINKLQLMRLKYNSN